MAKGTVKWFDPQKGFGFIFNQDGLDVFVHFTGIECDGYKALRCGQVVEYNEVQTENGLQAREVHVLEVSERVEKKRK